MRKPTKSAGLILITVLIFINLIILLVMLGFGFSELELRMSDNQLQHAQLLQTAQAAVQAACKQIQFYPPNCQIAAVSSYDLSIKSTSWWHSGQTCHGKLGKQNYFYVVQPLQVNNCLYFADSSAVKYWRITARAEQSAAKHAVIILQQTIAMPTKETQSCPTTKYELFDYKQSWRELR